MDVIGLIAGNGRFPILFAESARRQGVRVVAVAHEGETDPEIDAVADAVSWVRVGELGKIIRAFRDGGVSEAVMAGGIRKVRLFGKGGARPDWRAARLLTRLRNLHDDALLRAVAEEIESDGIRIVSSTILLDEILAGEGVLGRRKPKRAEERDVELGFAVAKGVGSWDVGQSVVVRNGVVVAVEGVEGTDACCRRGASLAGEGIVLVKVSKPDQDLRFDVPAVGPGTIEVLEEVGGRVLAVETGKTLLLEKDILLARADEAGIAVVGVAGPRSTASEGDVDGG